VTLTLDPAEVLAEAARLRENAMKDKTYRETPLGALAGRYLDEIAFQGYADKTVDGREGILYHLAFDLAHLQPHEVTFDHLKTFLADRWSGASRNTKASATSAVKVLFAWAHDNDLIPSNPARKLRGPRGADTERRSHPRETIRKLVVAQDQQRDRVAMLVLYWCGLRRNELRLVQFRHIDLANRLLTVFGKGGTVLEQNIPPALALELERHILTRQPHPDEYLLHPQKWGRRGRYPLYSFDVVWEDRRSPYSYEGVGAWWRRMLKNASVDLFPMHELRHTAGTHFHQESHDLVATKHFMRHKSVATTEKTYIHLDRLREVADVQRRMVDPLDEA
jgi:integrase